MSAPTNHWKLGLFVVLGTIGTFAFVLWLGTRSFRERTMHYVSFFDESVTGLEVGSKVAFRGVSIGNVAEISIAPDRRHVEIHYDLSVSELSRLGLVNKAGEDVQMKVSNDLRVQIASAGVTGNKYVKLDFLPNSPVEELSFPVPENFIPASPSTLKNLEDSITKALDNLPVVVERVLSVLTRADQVMAEFQAAGIPKQASNLLLSAQGTVSDLHSKINSLDTELLSANANQALAQLSQVLTRADQTFAKVNSNDGLLASVQRATDAMGDVAVGARGTGPKLDHTLEEVSALATSMQRLLDALERDSDMLLKGRARSEK